MLAPATPLADVLEKELQAQAVELARLIGWDGYHTHDSRRSQHGWPDYAFLRERLILVEFKREKTRCTPVQKKWLRKLHNAGIETYVIRPRNLDALSAVLMMRCPDGVGAYVTGALDELRAELDKELA